MVREGQTLQLEEYITAQNLMKKVIQFPLDLLKRELDISLFSSHTLFILTPSK